MAIPCQVNIKPLQPTMVVIIVGCIYSLTSRTTGKIYIGRTIDIDRRMKDHEKKANSGSRTKFYEAIREYGLNDFDLSIIEDGVPECELDEKEIYYINIYNTVNDGYNTTIGGKGTVGYVFTEEDKIKISRASTGREVSKEVRDRISESQKGKIIPEETKMKQSEFWKGKRKGPENNFYGKKHTKESLDKMKESTLKYSVEKRDIDTDELIKVYDTVEDAANFVVENNLSKAKKESTVRGAIYRCCSGRCDTMYGYRWNYIERCND